MNKYLFICFFFVLLNTVGCTKSTDPVKKSLEAKISPVVNWQLIGPGDADQVSAINISSQGIVYVSMDIGGVYKSSDWGESWHPLNQGIKNYDIVTPVIISPDDGKILYIGTRGGVYKSVNGGQTWQVKWSGIGRGKPSKSSLSACIGSIALDPRNPRTIYAGIGYRPSSEGSTVVKRIKWKGDIYRSDDRGETWKLIVSLGKNVMIRHINLMSSKLIYVATGAGLFKSADAGKTWQNIFPVPSKYIISPPEKPDVLYVSTGGKGIYKSLDAGNKWVDVNKGLNLRPGRPGKSDNYTKLLVDNKNPNIVYAINTTWGRGGGVYKSENSGDSWEKITKWQSTSDGINNVGSAWLKSSRRVNTISIDPKNSDRVFIGTSRYIYKTEDRGKTWHQLISRKVSADTWEHRGINVFGHTRVVGIDPVDSNRLYIGTADHGLVKSVDSGKSWKQSVKGMYYKDTISDIAVNPIDNSIVYAINVKGGFKESGVVKSSNFGENWRQLNNGLKKTMYYTILIESHNPDILYVGGQGVVYMTTDGGENWLLKNQGIENRTVRKLLFHPGSKGIIYAATDGGLFKSIDGGGSWYKTHLSSMNLYEIIIDPQETSTIYVGAIQNYRRMMPGGVFKSLDGGIKWKRVLNIRRIESMAIVPGHPSIIYALSNDFQYHDESSGEGVFRSDDGGDTWEKVNKGLAVHRGFNLNIAPYPPYKIYLSTQGSGAYVATDPAAAVMLQ